MPKISILHIQLILDLSFDWIDANYLIDITKQINLAV